MIQIFFYQNLNNKDEATDELKKEDEDGERIGNGSAVTDKNSLQIDGVWVALW